MSKLIMIHTISKFRHAYAVRVDDDANPEEVFQLLENEDDELYQTWCGETFETSYDITEEDVIKAFDINHSYIQNISKERKLEFIRDKRTDKEEE